MNEMEILGFHIIEVPGIKSGNGGFHFIGATGGSGGYAYNIQLFKYDGQVWNNDYKYDIYTNGELTTHIDIGNGNMKSTYISSLTYKNGDEIRIVAKDDSVKFYPRLHLFKLSNGNATSTNAIKEILEPLPLMSLDMVNPCTHFVGCFNNATLLENVCDELFKYNPAIVNFNGAFTSCTGLKSLPANIFKYNTDATTFADTFFKCSNLTSIPADLFKHNTNAQDVSACFRNTGLTSIPNNLFKYNSGLTNVSYCFNTCINVKSIPSDIFTISNNPNITNFKYCFFGCRGVTSALPALWNQFKNAAGLGCFNYCTNASNYSSVPNGWR